MIYLYWRLVFAIHRWLQSAMPTNRLAFAARHGRGPTWLPPMTLLTGLCYFCAAWLCAADVRSGGADAKNLLVLLFSWNGMKLAASGLAGLLQHAWNGAGQDGHQDRHLLL